MSRSWYFVPIAFLSGCALVKQFLPPEDRPHGDDRPYGVSESAERINGLQAMVAGIAMQDFIRARIAETEEQGWLAPDGGVLPPDLDAGWPEHAVDAHRCAHSPANFTTWLELDGGVHPRWLVSVMPSGECNWPMFGGGAQYEIDGVTFEILNRQSHE